MATQTDTKPDTDTKVPDSAPSTESLAQELLATAAHLGNVWRETAEQDAKARKANADKRDELNNEVKAADRKAGAFSAPMFMGLAAVAAAFGRVFNDTTTQQAGDMAKNAATSFTTSFTAQTDKSKGGGTGTGFENMIRLGSLGESARRALQDRIEHWQAVEASGADENDATKKSELIAKARRYISLPVDCPDKDGKWPVGHDKKPKMPKYNGRPGAVFTKEDGGEIVIKRSGATDRKAQMAAFSLLVHEHGEAMFKPEIVDAFLDNGGRWTPPKDVTVGKLCDDAQKALEQLILNGGANTADHAFLNVAIATLARIAESGFRNPVVQDNKGDFKAESKEPAPKEDAPKEDAPKEDESKEPESLPQGAPVVLGGAPNVPNVPKAGRKPAARKGAARRAGGKL